MQNASNARLLVCSIDSLPNIGGVSTLAYELTRVLAGAVAECIYLGPKSMRFDTNAVNFRVYNDWESEPRLRAGKGADLEDARLFDLIANIVESCRIDAMIAYHPFYYALPMVSVGKALGVPTAVVVHGTELTSQFPHTHLPGMERDDRTLESDSLPARLSCVLTGADHVLANSSYTAEIARRIETGINASTIGCGVTASVLQREIDLTPRYDALEKRSRRERLGLDGKPTIIYTGRLVRHKNLTTLIDLAGLTGCNALIVGQGKIRRELEAHAKKAGVSAIFMDPVDEATKWDLIRAADFGYLMSTFDEASGGYEGFGISMLEYTAAGAPCISNGLYGTAMFARRMETTVGGDRPIDVVADEITATLADEQAMNALLHKARGAIADHHTWEKVADRVLSAFA